MRRSVCLFAGLLCVAAVFYCGSVAAQEPEAPSEAGQNTEQNAAPVPSLHKTDNNTLALRHIYTTELKHNKGQADKPQKRFLLDIDFLSNFEYVLHNIVLETNVGRGFVQQVGFSSTDLLTKSAIINCFPQRGDDCSPKAIIIHKAMADFRWDRLSGTVPPDDYVPPRIDITDMLRRHGDRSRLFENPDGLLPPASPTVAQRHANKEIVLDYAGSVDAPYAPWVILSFPPEEAKKYQSLEVLSTIGNDEWTSDVASSFNRYIPIYSDDRLLILNQYEYLRVKHRYDRHPSCPDYGPIISAPGGFIGFPAICIDLFYGYTKKNPRKKVDLLPRLRLGHFRSLPIHGPQGLLPLSPIFSESYGPEAP